jgi:TonB-dependent starch-binding outer membrane protein SusC
MEITAYCHRLAVFTAIKHQRVLTKKIWLVMKLTTFLMMAACLQISARGLTQTLTLSFKNASLEKVFSEIQRQTGYSFFYEDGLLKDARPVDIAVVKASITQVLDMCFNNQPYTYKIVKTSISVKRKEQLANVISHPPNPGTGDPVTVSGRVTDPQGNPLAGANVKVKGSNVGTVTDNLGKFTLPDLDANAVLEISFVGYDPQTIHVKGKTLFSVSLGQKLAELDEAVIIAYGKTSRRFTTGNIATVKAADIEKQPVQNPLLALQGRVPGIEVTQLTGLNGGGVTVRIQGRNSIRSGLDPLIVIDGVPFPSKLEGATPFFEDIVKGGSPLNYVNPADIESIDVLKDADATAIYGSRAANGAILITTKKGKAGRTKLNFNLQQGWGKVSRKLDMMNTRQYLDMRYEALRNDGIIWTAPSYRADDLKVWDTTRYTDWQKELIGGTSKYTNINTSVSGGTSAVQYLIGATYNRQTTIFSNDFDDKIGSVNINLTGSTNNQRFKIQLSGSYRYDENKLPSVDLTAQALLLEPVAPPLFKEDGSLNWAPNAAGTSTWTNPLVNLLSSDFNNTTKNLISNVNLSYRIINGLELRTSLGYTNLSTQLYMPKRLEFIQPESRPNVERQTTFGNRNMSSWIVEPMLQYSRIMGKGKIEGLLGSTIQKSSFSYLGVSGRGYAADLLMKSLLAASSTTIDASSSGLTRYNALFVRLSYNWDDKYLVNLTGRRDGSNKFGDKNRFNNFGSIGLGWIISQEKWISQNFPGLSFAKLRSSYGVTGNDQIADFSYLGIYSISNPTVLYQNSISLNATNIPNPYIEWERTRKWQSGLDLGIIKDRLLLGITYARNRSSNQLINYPIPSFTGFISVLKNLPATIQNTSWEFTLNTVNVKNKAFSWTTNMNLTIPRNKVISFPGIELTTYANGNQGVVVGQPLGVTRVFQYSGLNPANGLHYVLDKNDNPAFAANPVNKFISTQTSWYGGIVNNISYRGLQLDFLIQFVRRKSTRDFTWRSGSLYPGQFSAGSSNQPVTMLDRWQKPGDISFRPRYSTSPVSNAVLTSDAYYSFDGSYVRVKNVSLSWQLPRVWVKKASIQNALLYLRAQNLAVFTNYKGLDPESGATGMPPLLLWTAGLNVEL